MNLDAKQRQIGTDNFNDVLQLTRRDFLAGVASGATVASVYWGYTELKAEPVRVGIIGTGDQGNAHINSSNPKYLRFVAFSDIRPSNQKRAMNSFEAKYKDKAKDIKLYENYKDLLARDDVEMVIIALPLHLHAPVTIEALKAGKHVLCEKLMAKTVKDCKEMARTARKTGKLLAIGHQRHYSYLYANALEIIKPGKVLGDVRHIRAFWHRNQTRAGAEGAKTGKYDSWSRSIPEEDKAVNWKKYGYNSLNELVSWRLHGRTGGGLMVELGSHQLDAASIMLGKIHPVAVSGVGVTSFFTDGREVEDHVFLTYEFPKKVIVTYSSICTNAFDKYGEQVNGTRGTLILEQERNVYLFAEGADSKNTRVNWVEKRIGQPVAEATSTTQWTAAGGIPDTLTSRGYREEQEHMAYCIRHPGTKDKPNKPRCNEEVALADAVVTLASNVAMRQQKHIVFKKEWFDIDSNEAPDA